MRLISILIPLVVIALAVDRCIPLSPLWHVPGGTEACNIKGNVTSVLEAERASITLLGASGTTKREQIGSKANVGSVLKKKLVRQGGEGPTSSQFNHP